MASTLEGVKLVSIAWLFNIMVGGGRACLAAISSCDSCWSLEETLTRNVFAFVQLEPVISLSGVCTIPFPSGCTLALTERSNFLWMSPSTTDLAVLHAARRRLDRGQLYAEVPSSRSVILQDAA